MDKKKKMILIIAIVVIAIIMVSSIICIIFSKHENNTKISKVAKLYETLKEKDSYSFLSTLNDSNKMYYAKLNDMAYTDTFYNGNESKYIIRDGNSYLLKDDEKEYYTYTNNMTDLNKIEVQLAEIKDMEYEEGKEKIEKKEYQYEEYKIITSFTMQSLSETAEEQDVKTRFYFEKDKLVYIKTIIGDKQELLKIEISNKVDNNLFEIPSNYKGK